MDPFLSKPLHAWRLDGQKDANGDRYHQSSLGLDCWRPVSHLGNGTFGDVWQELCLSGPSQNAVRAVKHIRKRQSNFSRASQRELEALITFSDARVPQYQHYFVQCLGWFDDNEHLYIAMEFMQYGDLQKYITMNPLSELEAASITAQVAQALQHMHQNNFVHRDLKPLNILVSSPGPEWHVKVADFGIAKNTDGTALGTYNIGTPAYMAPELLDDSSGHYTAAVDVWALGAVAFCMRTGRPPFLTHKQLFDYAHADRIQFPVRALGTSSGFCMTFVLGTMAKSPEQRFTIEQVLAHDWLCMVSGATQSFELDTEMIDRSTTWGMTPSNPWSNTYHDSTITQQPQPAWPVSTNRPPQRTSWGLPPPPSTAPPPAGRTPFEIRPQHEQITVPTSLLPGLPPGANDLVSRYGATSPASPPAKPDGSQNVITPPRMITTAYPRQAGDSYQQRISRVGKKNRNISAVGSRQSTVGNSAYGR